MTGLPFDRHCIQPTIGRASIGDTTPEVRPRRAQARAGVTLTGQSLQCISRESMSRLNCTVSESKALFVMRLLLSYPVAASDDVVVANREVLALLEPRAAPAVDYVQRHHLVLLVHLVAVVVQQVRTVA